MERLHFQEGIFIMPELLDRLLDLVGIITAGYFLQPSSLKQSPRLAVKRVEYFILFILQAQSSFSMTRGKTGIVTCPTHRYSERKGIGSRDLYAIRE